MASEGEGKVYWRVNFVRFDRPQEAGGDRGFGRLPPQSDPSGNVNIVFYSPFGGWTTWTYQRG